MTPSNSSAANTCTPRVSRGVNAICRAKAARVLIRYFGTLRIIPRRQKAVKDINVGTTAGRAVDLAVDLARKGRKPGFRAIHPVAAAHSLNFRVKIPV